MPRLQAERCNAATYQKILLVIDDLKAALILVNFENLFAKYTSISSLFVDMVPIFSVHKK